MTSLDRRAVLGRFLAGAFVAAAGASLLPTIAEATPLMDALGASALLDAPVEQATVRTTCWWRGGRRVCTRRRVRRDCWWRGGRRICHWR